MRHRLPRPILQFCHIGIKEHQHIILFDGMSMVIPNPAAGTALSALERQKKKKRKSRVARERFEWLSPSLGIIWQG
jgi:hypothetical protein